MLKRINARKLRSLAVAIFVLGILCFAVMAGLSWSHYKTPIYHPVVMWHGANLKLLTTFSKEKPKEMTSLTFITPPEQLLAVAPGDKIDAAIATELTIDSRQMSRLIKGVESRQRKFHADMDKLKQSNNELQNTKLTVSNLKQDFTTQANYQSAQLSRQDSIESLAYNVEDVPTDEQASLLVAERDLTVTQNRQRVPDSVLINVQNTTGISPQEINQLLNQ